VAGMGLQSMTADPIHKERKQFNCTKVRLAHYDEDDKAMQLQETLIKVMTIGFIA
jgi:hypothetical protein